MDLFLSVFLPVMVIFLVEWKRFVPGEVVANVLVIGTNVVHAVDVFADNCGKVCVVPLGVACLSAEVLRGMPVVMVFFCGAPSSQFLHGHDFPTGPSETWPTKPNE